MTDDRITVREHTELLSRATELLGLILEAKLNNFRRVLQYRCERWESKQHFPAPPVRQRTVSPAVKSKRERSRTSATSPRKPPGNEELKRGTDETTSATATDNQTTPLSTKEQPARPELKETSILPSPALTAPTNPLPSPLEVLKPNDREIVEDRSLVPKSVSKTSVENLVLANPKPRDDFLILAQRKKEQEAADQSVEAENATYREQILLKQSRIQSLQQEAFFIGLPANEIAKAIGIVIPGSPMTSNRAKRLRERNSQVVDQAAVDSSETPQTDDSGLDPQSGGDLKGSKPSTEKATQQRRPTKLLPEQMVKDIRFVDSNVSLAVHNRQFYFSKESRISDIESVREAISAIDELQADTKNLDLDELTQAQLRTLESRKKVLRLLLREMETEAATFGDTLTDLEKALQQEVDDLGKDMKELNEYVGYQEQNYEEMLREYLKNVINRERDDFFESTRSKRQTKPSDTEKGVQISLETDDYREGLSILARLAQQEATVKRICHRVDNLLGSLSVGSSRFDTTLSCPKCFLAPTQAAKLYVLWPCGHSSCEECLLRAEVDYGEYVCPHCGQLGSEVPNDVLISMTAKLDFRASGLQSVSDCLTKFRDQLASVDESMDRRPKAVVPSDQWV